MEQFIGMIFVIIFLCLAFGILNALVYGGIFFIIVVIFLILSVSVIDRIDSYCERKKFVSYSKIRNASGTIGTIFGLLVIGGIFWIVGYSILYHEMHGKPTALFKSSEIIEKEENEKKKQIELEILNKASLETSYAFKYLDDYNKYVQKIAIKKLTSFKDIDIVQKKFIEIGKSGYQHFEVREDALCAIKDNILYDGILENIMDSWSGISSENNINGDKRRILAYCLSEQNIKNSQSLRKTIIDIYEHKDSNSEIMHIALKYEEDKRIELADYLIDRDSISRFFNIKAWFKYFSNEDILEVIKALSNRELILGDKHIKEALVDILKVKDSKIIRESSEALRKAFKWDLDAQNILASHLKSDDEEIRHEAIYALEQFYASDEASIISKVIPILNDKSSQNRKLAIETLKPLFEDYSKIKENQYDKKSQLIVEAYNKITYLSKNDLDKYVRKKALSAIEFSK